MSLYRTPEENAANPPETWIVVKAAPGVWHLRDLTGGTLDSYPTRKAAEAARTDGPAARLWDQESRWHAGETIPGWRPWAEVR